MIVPHTLPRLVQIGVAQALTLTVTNDAGTQQTATAATLTVKLGEATLVDAVAATSLGPPASYTLPAATTTGYGPSMGWLEKWSVTIGGVVYPFSRSGYLVRRLWFPTITDGDLTVLHAELTDHIPAGTADYSGYRGRASDKIQRDLLKKGKRAWLIFDAWALTDAHVALSLHYIFFDWATEFGESRYKELAEHYAELYREEMGSVVFTYDSDEDDVINESERKGTGQPIVLTAGAPWAGRWAR